MRKTFLLCTTLFILFPATAQNDIKDTLTIKEKIVDTIPQKDAIDIIYWVLKKDASKRTDTTHIKPGRVYFSGAIAPSYSLQTGFAAEFAGNFAFYLGEPKNTKISSILADIAYTQYSQLILPLESSVWSKNNNYNFIGDWRFLKYPQDTYGIGSDTKLSDGYTVSYNYVRVYQFALRKIKNNLYGGLGVQYDNHFNISEELPTTTITDFKKYGFSKSSISSGIGLSLVYNTVDNMINPEGGSTYANITLRQNFSWMGSDANWNSAIIDLRKYVSTGSKKNVFAFWSYDWLTTGHPPYLDLPSIGWDTYSNTGRGYVQSRYRGKDMLYLESEFRFGITRNGLFGGVVFANAESFTGLTNKFEKVLPAAGLGIRVKFNKFSRTNVALDYGVGTGGSKGVFINLGEVF